MFWHREAGAWGVMINVVLCGVAYRLRMKTEIERCIRHLFPDFACSMLNRADYEVDCCLVMVLCRVVFRTAAVSRSRVAPDG